MTVIVYRAGVLAADTAVWSGDGMTICGSAKKIRRLADGTLVAAGGATSMIAAFHAWLAAGAKDEDRKKPSREDGFDGIVVRPNGTVERYGLDWMPAVIEAPYHVIGRAQSFTAGALAAGASAKEAVRLTIEFTDGGAGDVQVEQLNPVVAKQRGSEAQSLWPLKRPAVCG